MQDREASIRARAHQLWEESGHEYGRHEQHWRQAEREYDEARLASVVQLVGEDISSEPVEAVAEALAPYTKKPRAPRKLLAGEKLS